MFGLTFEKLVVVGLFAALILGPQRLPVVVAYIAGLVGGLRRTMDAARVRAAAELGVPSDATSWRALDPRQYDPRRIIAEALTAPAAPAPPADLAATAAPVPAAPAAAATAAPAPAAPAPTTSTASHASPPPADDASVADTSVADASAADTSASDREDVASPVGSRPPADRIPGATRWVRGGTSAHPRWILVTDDDADLAPSATATNDARASAVV